MALAALCGDDEWGRSWAEIMQYRFTSDGPLNGHAVGNLLLAALWDRDEDPVEGLDRVAALLKVNGRVLPMANEPLDIEATFLDSDRKVLIRGQKEVALAQGKFESLRLIPENPRARAEALSAIHDADVISMGPGSWISSVLPHVLVPEQRQALLSSKGKKVLILNLDDPHSGEFSGRSAIDHLSAILAMAPELHFDYVIADSSTVNVSGKAEILRQKVSTQGGELLLSDLRSKSNISHHDPKKLALLFSHIVGKSLVG
jgi:uncharacterized cofD-like protein